MYNTHLCSIVESLGEFHSNLSKEEVFQEFPGQSVAETGSYYIILYASQFNYGLINGITLYILFYFGFVAQSDQEIFRSPHRIVFSYYSYYYK